MYRFGAQKRPQVRVAGVFRFMCRRVAAAARHNAGGSPEPAAARRKGQRKGLPLYASTAGGATARPASAADRIREFCPGERGWPPDTMGRMAGMVARATGLPLSGRERGRLRHSRACLLYTSRCV